MGARRGLVGAAAIAALILAARAEAATVWEPIARLTLEGRWDSNVLYDGRADTMARVSPEVGLRLLNRRMDLQLAYGGDYMTYRRLQSDGTWNHRGSLRLEARPTRRVSVAGRLRGGYAFDPVGLALAGVFRSGQEGARTVDGTFRAEWRATERVDVAGTFYERLVRFDSGVGGAMHQPGVEALWRTERRLDLGAGYRFAVFQETSPAGNPTAYSHSLRARARWRATRFLTLEGGAGPALWNGPDGTAVVPEASVQLLGSERRWDLRTGLSHGLGLGTTALPGLVDAFEFAGRRRLGLRYEVRAEGGVWRTGRAPSGRDAVIGYVAGAEGAILFGDGVRLALAATHFDRVDDSSTRTATLRRTMVGLRLGWERPLR
jgi:hypothetical protein